MGCDQASACDRRGGTLNPQSSRCISFRLSRLYCPHHSRGLPALHLWVSLELPLCLLSCVVPQLVGYIDVPRYPFAILRYLGTHCHP